MSHGIDQLANGDFTFVRRAGTAPGWHSLGQEYDGPENVMEFARAGYASFRTALVPLVGKVPTQYQLDADGNPTDVVIREAFDMPLADESMRNQLIVRLDTLQPLATVGHEYEMVENSDVWRYLQQWVDAGLGVVDTAGSLFGGKKNFVNLKMVGEPMVIKGNDTMQLNLLTMNPFDGNSAIYTGFSNIRPVCNNTVTAAIADRASKMLRIKHRGDMTLKMEAAQDILRMAYEDQAKNAEMFRFLASKPILNDGLLSYVNKLWGYDKIAAVDMSTRAKNMRDQILSTINTAAGQSMPETRGTYYWAFQGVNFYVNHVDGRTPQSRMDNLLFGATRKFDQQALDLAISMANAA